MPAHRRIRKPAEFRAILGNRTSLTGEFLKLYVKPNEADHGRIGLIVAKRIERKAVKRNRIKRLLKEAFRHHQWEVSGQDCIFQLRAPVTSPDLPRFHQEAVMLLLRAAQLP